MAGILPKPGVHCPRCGKKNDLAPTYGNYNGRLQCKECGCSFGFRFQLGYLMETPRILPPSDVELPTPPVPKRIQQDLLEAGICFSAGSPVATIVLYRRALEGLANELGAKGRTLFDKMKDLYSSERIPKPLYEASTEIRVFGNYGAHPSEDLLDDIEENQAREVLYFTREMVDDIYVKPRRLDDLRKQRKRNHRLLS